MAEAADLGDRPHSARPLPIVVGEFSASSIDLYITSSCNRRCSYCFLTDAYLNSGTRMSLEMIMSILGWSATRGPSGEPSPVEEITLLGGEPSLHPDFAEIVRTVARTGFRARVVTNGNPQFRATLEDGDVVEGLGRVAISVDAPTAEQFDHLRGRGAFADAITTIRAVADAGIPFDINFTVLRSNLDSVAHMLSFGDQIGANRLNIHWFSQVGRARRTAPDEQISAIEWRDRVLQIVRDYRPLRSDYKLDPEMAFAYRPLTANLEDCAVRDRTNLQFFPGGAVFACGMLVDDEGGSAYVWRDGALYQRRGPSEITATEKKCGGCPVRKSSDGHRPVCIYSRL